MPKTAHVPVYLNSASDGPRIMEAASLSPIGTDAWLQFEVAGMLLRFVLTPAELDELIAIAEDVRQRLRDAAAIGCDGC